MGLGLSRHLYSLGNLMGVWGLLRGIPTSHLPSEQTRSTEVMGRKAREKKQAEAWVRYNALCHLADQVGTEVRMLNEYPMHVRLHGATSVDYWPSTERAWVYGHPASVKPITPEEVVKLTQSLAEPLPPGAREHLKDLQSRRAVAEGETPKHAPDAQPADDAPERIPRDCADALPGQYAPGTAAHNAQSPSAQSVADDPGSSV